MLPWLFVSDVDDTLLGDDPALTALAAAPRPARERVVVAYNSSRPCASLRRSLAEVSALPPPDYLIGALGTEIEAWPSGARLGEHSLGLRAGWQREAIAALMSRLGFEAHAEEVQTPYKASYGVSGEAQVRLAREQLAATGLGAQVIFSGGKNLDLIPVNAGKGHAAEYLRRRLGIRAESVVVAGDSGNDRDMFCGPFKGIVVGNAEAALRSLSGGNLYQARAAHAAGVLEGLKHWAVLSP